MGYRFVHIFVGYLIGCRDLRFREGRQSAGFRAHIPSVQRTASTSRIGGKAPAKTEKGAGTTLKRGSKISSIRLTDNEDEVDCRHDKIKGLVLRVEFLKKA